MKWYISTWNLRNFLPNSYQEWNLTTSFRCKWSVPDTRCIDQEQRVTFYVFFIDPMAPLLRLWWFHKWINISGWSRIKINHLSLINSSINHSTNTAKPTQSGSHLLYLFSLLRSKRYSTFKNWSQCWKCQKTASLKPKYTASHGSTNLYDSDKRFFYSTILT